MKKRIRSIGVLSAGMIIGALYAVLGLFMAIIFVPIALIAMSLGEDVGSAAPAIGILIFGVLSPFLYGALGFIGGVIVALVYNLLARLVGGLEIELEDVPPATPA